MGWREELTDLTEERTIELLKRYAAKTSPLQYNPDFVPEYAEGMEIVAKNGKRFLDFSANICSEPYGQNNEKIHDAIRWAHDNLIPNESPNVWPFRPRAILSQKLATLAENAARNLGIDAKFKVYTTVGGSNAVEDAMRRFYHFVECSPYLTTVFAFKNAFHGSGFGASRLHDSNPVRRKWIVSEQERAMHIEFPLQEHRCSEYREREIPRICRMIDDFTGHSKRRTALFAECIQGEGGANIACFNCFPAVIDLFQRDGHLFIADDIQMSFYRTGKMFSWEHYARVPDMFTLAKALSPSANLSANVFRADLDYKEYGTNSCTGPAALGFITALAGLDLLSAAVASGRLKEAEAILAEVAPYGLGLMRAVECGSAEKATAVVERSYAHQPVGILLLRAGTKIRFSPPYPQDDHDLELLREGAGIIRDILRECGVV